MKVFFAIFLAACATAYAEPLAALLSRMDRAAADFHSLSAKMKRIDYTAVIDDKSESSGELRLLRAKNKAVALVKFDAPNERVIHISGNHVEVFYPKANTEEIYDTSKYTPKMDQFLLLGFGTTAAELNSTYSLRALGTESVAGMMCTRLELTPKAGEIKKLITKIELWIPEGQSNPIQEKITQPSNNYSLATYSEMKFATLPDSALELQMPSGVKKIYPQK